MRRQAAASVAVSDADRTTLSVPAASAAVGLLAVLTYAATLGFGFVWDDPISVQRWLPAIAGVGDAFFPPPNIPQFPNDYYRPLQLLSYRLDHAIGGGAPWPFHLTVVLLHGLATILVFRCAAHFLPGSAQGRRTGVWAGALFAVHPIHSESVAWMAARPDVMVACAGLGALLAYRHGEWSTRMRAGVAAVLIFVGLLGKETAAALLLMVPLSTLILGPVRKSVARGARATPEIDMVNLLPFGIAFVAYLVLRAAGSYATLPDASWPSNPAAALLAAVGMYLRLLLLPYPQNAYVADLPTSGGALALSTLLVGAFVVLLARAWKQRNRPLVFALVWIGVTLTPSLSVIAQPETAPLAERYLYLPSIGFCWAFGIVVARAAASNRAARRTIQGAALCVILIACGATVQRNWIWTDNFSLWSDTAEKSDVDGLPLRSLAAATLEKGDAHAAERLFVAALERRNTTRGKYVIYNNLGTIALGRNDESTAERYYRQAAEFEPAPALLYNLGLIRLRRGLQPAPEADGTQHTAALHEAKGLFERAIAASPHDAEIHIGLAQTAEALHDSTTARRHYQKALDLGVSGSTKAAVQQRLEAINSVAGG